MSSNASHLTQADSAREERIAALVAKIATAYAAGHLVAHPRKGRDEKESPGKMDVAGSSKITDGADNVLSVWSAKRDPDAPNYQPEEIDGRLSLHKQRNGDVQERSIPLWLERGSQQFCPTSRRRTMHFVPFDKDALASLP